MSVPFFGVNEFGTQGLQKEKASNRKPLLCLAMGLILLAIFFEHIGKVVANYLGTSTFDVVTLYHVNQLTIFEKHHRR